jgi:glutamate/tyrosine decarboxylase-like PLP-dependent enzyme
MNEVGLNQVLVRYDPPEGENADEFHRAIASRVQADGRCWLGTTTWHGKTVLRFSICNASTTAADISTALEVLAEAIRHASSHPSARRSPDTDQASVSLNPAALTDAPAQPEWIQPSVAK